MASGDEAEEPAPPRRAWTRPGNDWVPGDDDGLLPFDDLHLHRYCAVYPFQPDDDPQLEDGSNGTGAGGVELRFIDGVPRRMLRQTPFVVLVASVLVFGTAEVYPHVDGLSALLPSLAPGVGLALVAGGALVAGTAAALLVSVGITDFRELYAATVVYGLLAGLGLGTVGSVVFVVFRSPTALEPNVIFASGYLLLVLLGGLLTYDLLLRCEHMFERLGDTHVVADSEGYRRALERLRADLTHTLVEVDSATFGRVGVPTAYVAPLLGVVPALAVWTATQGPQGLNYPVTIAVNVGFDYLVGILVFQFIVLVHWFYGLVTDDITADTTVQDREQGTEARGPVLTYVVYHPDGHGGYRDLGKFATRVNVLLILSGLYVVYRLFVQGLRVPPAQLLAAEQFTPTTELGFWLLNYAGPIVLYPLLVGVWLYYSFWQLHLRMLRERERLYVSKSTDFTDEGSWHIRRDGPAWPVSNVQLLNLLLGSITPVMVSTAPLLLQRLG